MGASEGRKVLCRACGGSGVRWQVLYNVPYECSTCDGTGKVVVRKASER